MGGFLLNSPQLDILSADVATGPTTLVAVLRLASLTGTDATALAARWSVSFQINGHPHTVVARRDANGDYTAAGGNALALAPVALAVDAAAATLTFTVPRGAVAELATPGVTIGPFWAGSVLWFVSADAAYADTTYVDQSPGCVPAA